MAKIKLTDGLRREYEKLFETCSVRPQYQSQIDAAVAKMITNKARYAALGQTTGVPWTLIAVLHELECSQKFDRHLHNGDPLGAKTVQEPKGRPPGPGPWTWEESATDALSIEGWTKWNAWSLSGTLYKLEGFNGFGYRSYHPSVLTPYLWSYSTHYTAGKYKADGVFSPTLVSKQPGTAVLLRRPAEKGGSSLSDEQPPQPEGPPLVVAYMASKPTDPNLIARAITLQNWLTTHTGIFVKPDGWAGRNTSDAYKLVTGHYLPGDPRG